MKSVFSHPILEVVTVENVQNLISLLPQPSSNKCAQSIINPNLYTQGFLDETDVTAINGLMDLMRQEGTKTLAEEPPESETEPAPLGSDDSLFYKEHLSVPRTQKFRKTPQQMEKYFEGFNEMKNNLIKKRIPIDKLQSEKERKEGNDNYNSQDYLTSLQKYQSSIFMDPSNSLCYSNRAAAYISLSHPDMAISDCFYAIKFDQNFIKPYLRIGRTFLDMGRYIDSLKWYNQARKIQPDNEEANVMKHMIIEKLKNAQFRYNGNTLLLRFFGISNKIRFRANHPDSLQPLIDYQILVVN